MIDPVAPHDVTAFDRLLLCGLGRRLYRCDDCGRRFRDRPLRRSPADPVGWGQATDLLAWRVLVALRRRPAVWTAGTLVTIVTAAAAAKGFDDHAMAALAIGAAVAMGFALWLYELGGCAARRLPRSEVASRRALTAFLGAFVVVLALGHVAIGAGYLANAVAASKKKEARVIRR